MRSACATKGALMRPLAVRKAKVTYPTGDPSFSVMQAFPAAFTAEEADPWLMLDHFGPSKSKGKETGPDDFPIGWHPHRGMDILTYMVEGKVRHADSMGNRETVDTPGMQWISVGSGIEHAEGGGTPAGQVDQGFQIWLNVPSSKKMDDPRYGTHGPADIPVVQLPSGAGHARVLAGPYGADVKGPFKTVQPVQLVDYELAANQTVVHSVPQGMDNCLVYVAKGSGKVSGADVAQHNVVRMAAEDPAVRDLELSSGPDVMRVLVFAGKRLRQPIAWHGPFVMTTDEEIRKTIADYRSGNFPPVRVPWDYKRLSTFPKDKLPK